MHRSLEGVSSADGDLELATPLTNVLGTFQGRGVLDPACQYPSHWADSAPGLPLSVMLDAKGS